MILGWSFYAIGRLGPQIASCQSFPVNLRPLPFLMDGLASFHDSASGGFPDYCHRKYLRPIRRVYLGAYKKGAFLDQYDSVQNGIKINYITF